MACRLPAPSHYLNQCWNVVNWTIGNKLQLNLRRKSYIFIQENAFENAVWKLAAILSRPQCVNTHWRSLDSYCSTVHYSINPSSGRYLRISITIIIWTYQDIWIPLVDRALQCVLNFKVCKKELFNSVLDSMYNVGWSNVGPTSVLSSRRWTNVSPTFIAAWGQPPWCRICFTWWRHQMKTFSALLVICAGNSTVTGEFPSQGPVTRSFGISVDLHLNKRLSKQWRGWWFETPFALIMTSPWWVHACIPSPWMTRVHLSRIVNTMAADGLVTQGARASAAMLLAWCSGPITGSSQEELN